MIRLLIVGTLLALQAPAYAGKAKLTWIHDSRNTAGALVQLTAFRVYWGMNGTPLSNIIELGPPVAYPWKVDPSGMGTYSKTLVRDEWQAGTIYCFQMTALTELLESDRSNLVCKAMSLNPDAPVLIGIGE